MEWPPYSPDLNAIENLWAILKEKLGCLPPPSNRGEMEARVKEVWMNDATISQACAKLSDSMPGRIEELFRNKGGATHY
jgi:transposase